MLVPRDVLVTEVTVPEWPQSAGDGKNRAPLPHHLRCLRRQLLESVAFLPPSSFGSRYGRANNKTPSSDSVVATDNLKILPYHPNSWPKRPIIRACAQ